MSVRADQFAEATRRLVLLTSESVIDILREWHQEWGLPPLNNYPANMVSPMLAFPVPDTNLVLRLWTVGQIEDWIKENKPA